MKITVLGQGAMGSRMADRLEAAGHEVRRWNRTGSSDAPREAVEAADIVIAMVRDDDASRAIWLDERSGAFGGLGPDTIAIESSTLTVEWVHQLGARMADADHAFLDAPVLGSRPQAEAGQLIHLVGGEAALLERLRPILAAISGKQLYAGPIGSGAALKLVANTLFGIQVAAVAELIGQLPAFDLGAARAIELLGETPLLSPAAKSAAGLMIAGTDDPMFPVDLVAKDFDYALRDQVAAMPLAGATRQVFARASSAGLGSRNLTAVARLYQRT